MIWLLPWEEHSDVRHFHWVLYLLLLTNAVVFLAMVAATPAEVRAWVAQYSLIAAAPEWYQWITSTFIHFGLLHLLGNIVFLWLFGDNIEDVLGHAGFFLLYFTGGLAGALLFVASNPDVAIPSAGASGCIAAVAGAYAVLFAGRPASVRVMFIVFPLWKLELRAFWLLMLWFGLDLAQTMYTRGSLGGEGGANYTVHAGGFAFGFVVGLLARMHGVARRYAEHRDGYFWFGYWSPKLDEEAKQARLAEIRRERARAKIAEMQKNEARAPLRGP
jgi:membrane associated rhomboid family serine protease